jgi:hypothetical protein
MSMTVSEILNALEPYTGQFPMEAMREAVAQREAITPELLRLVEAVAEEPLKYAQREDYMLHVFAVFLLAQFREKRAYAPIVKMVSVPGEIPFDLLGDTITEGLSRILASVYDGNPALLQGLVESESVNDFVRSSALDTFLVLEHTNQMPRQTVLDYFHSLFHGRLQRIPSYAWSSLVCAVADLPAPELLEEVRQAYADDLVDTMVTGLESIERDVAAPDPWRRERQHLIDDAIAEMEWWAAFHPEGRVPNPPPDLANLIPPSSGPAPAPYSYTPPKPFIREPKLGRNDPCSCGSGLKYKKCCGKA